MFFCIGNCLFGNPHRTDIRSHAEHFHTLLLLDCCWTVNVTSCKQWLSSFGLQFSGNLRRGRGLTCSLQADHHDDSQFLWLQKLNFFGLRSHESNQLFIYDLDHHLSGVQSVHHVLPYRTLLYRLDKLFDNLKADIRL